jgi:hypothetical protein
MKLTKRMEMNIREGNLMIITRCSNADTKYAGTNTKKILILQLLLTIDGECVHIDFPVLCKRNKLHL